MLDDYEIEVGQGGGRLRDDATKVVLRLGRLAEFFLQPFEFRDHYLVSNTESRTSIVRSMASRRSRNVVSGPCACCRSARMCFTTAGSRTGSGASFRFDERII